MKFIFSFLILLLSCNMHKKISSTIKIIDIKQGINLDKAIQTDYLIFFKKRMDNEKAYKEQGKRCEIINEKDEFIYYGYPLGLGEKMYVKDLFKVNKEDIIKHFPNYLSIEGYHVKLKVYESCIKENIPKEYFNLFTNIKYDITLIEEGIQVKANCNSNKDFLIQKNITCNILLDKNNLSVKSIF